MNGPEHLAALLLREEGIEYQVTGPVYTGPVSRVFRATRTGPGTPVAIKQYLVAGSGSLDRQEARKQFETQSRIARLMAERPDAPRFRVPRPLALHTEAAIVTMEWIQGVTLARAVLASRTSPARLGRAMTLAGQWLQHYHRAGSEREESGLDTRLMLAQLDEAIARAPRDVTATPVFRRTLAELTGNAERVSAVPIVTAWQHGDFKPQNVIIEGDVVHGTDIGHLHVNCTLVDVAHFLNHVDDLCLHPSGLKHALSRHRLRNAFIQGYDPEFDDAARLVLAWLRLQNLLRVHLEYAGTLTGRFPRIYDGARYRFLRKAARFELARALDLAPPGADGAAHPDGSPRAPVAPPHRKCQ